MTKQFFIGMVLTLSLILLGVFYFDILLGMRLFFGLAIGYILIRGSFGFGGMISRAYNTGSTKLFRYVMLLLVISSVFTTVGLLAGIISKSNLFILPISYGLVLGAFIFGVGMILGKGCASGTLTGIASNPINHLIVLLFFAIGVFVGFPLQAHFIKQGSTVWLADLVSGPYNGVLFAFVFTTIISTVLIIISYIVENRLKEKGFPCEHEAQLEQDSTEELSMFNRIFVKRFTLKETVLLLAIVLSLLLFSTGSQWGVTTTFGLWFGKLLTVFGVNVESLNNYAQIPGFFNKNLLDHGGTIQNVGIILGALIYLLTASKFKFHIDLNLKLVTTLILGGLLMGLGTRIAIGCNAGALFSAISGFSLSGWIFLVFMLLGGLVGSMALKKILSK